MRRPTPLGAWLLAVLVGLAIVICAARTDAAYATSRSLTISSPKAYQVFQRNAAGRAAIRITGRATGVSGSVQASWRGRPWVTIGRVSSGRYGGWLYGQPQGQGTLRVRSTGRKWIAASRSRVGVGDIFVIAGQSNAVGCGSVLSSYTNPSVRPGLFGNDYSWRRLTDPTDSHAGQVDRVSYDAKPHGSVWPLVATILAENSGNRVPIAFVPCAKGATTISEWARSSAHPFNRSTLYGSMVSRARRASRHVRAVLFWQGENDALAGTSRSGYRALLGRFCADVRRDLGVDTVVAQIGDYDDDPPRPAADDVRLAQVDLWLGGAPVVVGPVLYDVDLRGSNHFKSASQMARAAARWAAAIEAGVYHVGDGAGPVLSAAAYDGQNTITLTFSEQTLPLGPTETPLGGFTACDDGDPIAIASASVTGPDTVTLALAAPAEGVLTVSLGSLRSAAGQIVPTDSSSGKLPAWPFVGVRPQLTPSP